MNFSVIVKDERGRRGVGWNVVFSSETQPRRSEERKH